MQLIYPVPLLTSLKRKREEEEEDFQPKFQRKEPLRHIMMDSSLATEANELELFDNVRIIAYDPPVNGIKSHWHVIGIPKLTKRSVRDMSKASLEQITTNPSAKLAFMQMHYNTIKDQGHFDNLVRYCQKKKVVYENPIITFSEENKFDLLDRIRELKSQRSKHSPQEMDKFRKDYPFYNSWKTDSIKYRLGKTFVNHLQSLED